MPNLLTTSNSKTTKGEKLGYKTYILYLSPMSEHLKADQETIEYTKKAYNIKKVKYDSKINFCPNFGACGKYCLYTAGRGKFSNVKKGRIAKSLFYVSNKKSFEDKLEKELEKLSKKGEKIAIRLNGTSDNINSNKFALKFPDLIFYDYTKNLSKFKKFGKGELAKNYHLTFSYDVKSTTNEFWNFFDKQNLERKRLGKNLLTYAKIYCKDDFEKLLKNKEYINGDDSDLRFLDHKQREGTIVALKAKGDAIGQVRSIYNACN